MTTRFPAAVALAALLVEVTLTAQTVCPPQIQWQKTFGSIETDQPARILELPGGGFIIGGQSRGGPSGNKTSPNYGLSDFWLVRLDAEGNKLWDRSYGGNRLDGLGDLVQTSDGGFILAGSSDSPVSGNKTNRHNGNGDGWIVRTDSEGNKLWDKSFGGTGSEWMSAIRQTTDGGFIVGGGSEPGAFSDFWVLRLDAEGNKLWEGVFGGSLDDGVSDVQQTPDGGFIIAGTSVSTNDGTKTAVPYGGLDWWIVRLDSNGNQLWDRSYGGTRDEQLRAVRVLPNGDILLGGYSSSEVSGVKTVPRFGGGDFWLVRLDAAGNILSQAVYGGVYDDHLTSLAPAGSNAFLLAGYSQSPPGGSKTSQRLGDYDYWVVKVDGQGQQIWDASFGSLGTSTAQDAIATIDGGYIVVGSAYEGGSGNKTSPSYGWSDFWVVKLYPENALDCDNDSVPNAQDTCGETPPDALVNSNGCTIEQVCPCDGWLEHSNYVACVESASAEFQSAGLITSEQRAELVTHAATANCPPSVVLFGLVHLPIKDTRVNGAEFIPGTNIVHGANILLGEADEGIFLDPYAEIWGNAWPEWFLEGKVYGQIQGGSNALVARVRGTKPGVEVYPIEVDFSPLGATNVTFQFLSGQTLVTEESSGGPTGSVTIRTANELRPRVNPFWRSRDGSVGALIEFVGAVDHGDQVFYDRIFARAEGVAQQVNYISRVEVAGGGGFGRYSIVEELLGMFGHRHRISGNGLFAAANGQLTIKGEGESFFGTGIEFDRTQHFEADLLPIDLTYGDGRLHIAAQSASFSGLQISHETNHLQIHADLAGGWNPDGSNVPPFAASVEVKVFRNGLLAGSCLAPNSSVVGHLASSNQPPRIIGCMATVSSNTAPTIAFSVDQLAPFVCTNGNEIWGTHFQISPVNPEFMPADVVQMNLNLAVNETSAFTITGERSQSAQPRLSMISNGGDIVLSWPDNTRLYRLESSPTLPNGFTAVAGEPDFINNRNQIVLPRDSTGSRFFRLRSGPD